MDDIARAVSAEPAMAGIFDSLAQVVYASDDYSEVYDAVVRAAPGLIDGCDHASLMLLREGRFQTVAASDETARSIEAMEQEVGEGPCLDAIVEESVFHDADLTNGTPWPLLDQRVLAETPVRSMAGVRLRTADQKTGALNLFSDTPEGLTDRSVGQGIVLASFVSVALLASHERQLAATLREGLQSNREIGKAVGLMMAFHKIPGDEAFAMLRRTSQDMNLKLREVARRVVEHHDKAWLRC